jgi:hypothetical protein
MTVIMAFMAIYARMANTLFPDALPSTPEHPVHSIQSVHEMDHG